ncbi:MAG TPA: hypothetical protein VLJ14_00350 [Ktedonobacterales bacterium]|nr:hypothetical protein [Ktedonobacterales bacterium]
MGWSTLPFLPLFTVVSTADSSRMPNSSRFGRFGNLTFHVMGGKNGKKRQETATWMAKSGKKRQRGWQKRHGLGGV